MMVSVGIDPTTRKFSSGVPARLSLSMARTVDRHWPIYSTD
jgi:hypothetical protein